MRYDIIDIRNMERLACMGGNIITVSNVEPVYLTKNGYGSMVVLSLEKYAEITSAIELKEVRRFLYSKRNIDELI